MIKTIGLVAHDNRKQDLIEWVEYNFNRLKNKHLVCTGTTGRLVREALERKLKPGNTFENMTILKSGPLGGDQQLGAMIAEGKIDMLIFLWDPMQPQPHDVDVKALSRISVMYNVPTADNRATADFLITSSLYKSDYKPLLKDYSSYTKREI
ncbi:MAG: methylglyoxal synthase [Bacteroidales bacterium]|nr:methylglyoxal synthase [Bacteroidales bacterium]